MADDARTRAEESIAQRFTRVMNATTSKLGVLCDPPVVAVCMAPLLLVLLAAIRLDVSLGVIYALAALFALPLVVAIGVSLGLMGARRRVIDWLAGLPFPVENMNALLNGLGDGIEVTFADAPPKTAEINQELDKVSQDCFVTRAPDVMPDVDAKGNPAPPPDARVIEIRVGVVDSKRSPASTNYKRYERVRGLVGAVLVPLHAQHKVVEVRIK